MSGVPAVSIGGTHGALMAEPKNGALVIRVLDQEGHAACYSLTLAEARFFGGAVLAIADIGAEKRRSAA